ncbi:MAG: ECF transporter S component [Anaerolineales bacterium]
MDKKLVSVVGTLAVTLGIFALVVWRVEATIAPDFQLGDTITRRFGFVFFGMIIVMLVYLFSQEDYTWELGVRQAAYMFIGAALYAAFSALLSSPAFSSPAVSQVYLRPTIIIPMFFGYAFGPLVGFFTGAVGNIIADALGGTGLSPQWSLGNGLIGFVTGLAFLFKNKKKSMDIVMYISIALALAAAALFFFNKDLPNKVYYDTTHNIFGDSKISLFAGISIIIGLALTLAVRFGFARNEAIATAVIWGMFGNILGIGFAAISDIWINGYSLPAAIVGEFLPAAGPNLIFTAVLLPLLVIAYHLSMQQEPPPALPVQ